MSSGNFQKAFFKQLHHIHNPKRKQDKPSSKTLLREKMLGEEKEFTRVTNRVHYITSGHSPNPLTNVHGHRFQFYFLAALCFTAIFRICAFSRNSVNRSRWVHRFCWFWLWSYTYPRKEGSPISIGIIASAS